LEIDRILETMRGEAAVALRAAEDFKAGRAEIPPRSMPSCPVPTSRESSPVLAAIQVPKFLEGTV
jgi:hypothetical protein